MNESAVRAELIQKILKQASHFSLKRRESCIRQVQQLDAMLSREEIVKRLNEAASGSLPVWATAGFFTREINPILLQGLRSAGEEFEAMLDRFRSMFPLIETKDIRRQHALYRAGNRKKEGFTGKAAWPPEADSLLRETVAAERKMEAEAIRRACQRHPHVRPAAIQQRMALFRKRFLYAKCETFDWSPELDAKLIEAGQARNLPEVIKTISVECGISRDLIYRHCDELHIERRKRRMKTRSWIAADLRYLTDYANHQSARGIAEALGRSYWSVVRKLQQLGLSVAVSRESQAVYSLRDLREGLHVRHSTLSQWITEGKLVVAITKRTLKRGHQQRVKEEDLVAFLANYPEELNLANTEPDIQLLVEEFLKASLELKSRGAGA